MSVKLHLPTYCAHFSPVSIIRRAELEIEQHIRYTLVTKRLPRVRFVHLATHGIFDDVQGINNSIQQLI
jgi:CHAT domain-containing protein